MHELRTCTHLREVHYYFEWGLKIPRRLIVDLLSIPVAFLTLRLASGYSKIVRELNDHDDSSLTTALQSIQNNSRIKCVTLRYDSCSQVDAQSITYILRRLAHLPSIATLRHNIGTANVFENSSISRYFAEHRRSALTDCTVERV